MRDIKVSRILWWIALILLFASFFFKEESTKVWTMYDYLNEGCTVALFLAFFFFIEPAKRMYIKKIKESEED